MEVVKYDPTKHEDLWNKFISTARNATFQFNRSYIEYHGPEMMDHSLLVFQGEKLLMCMPANKEGSLLVSHRGLGYGAFICQRTTKFPKVLEAIKALLHFCDTNELSEIYLKTIPDFYCSGPNGDIEYCLTAMGAVLESRQSALILPQGYRPDLPHDIKRESNRGRNEGFEVKESEDLEQFWNELLIPRLKDRYDSDPVHSLEQIQYLKTKFPENIRLYCIEEDRMVAGTVIYETERVAHSQYTSSNERGRTSGALNYLTTTLINEVFDEKPYFDFGTAHDDSELRINFGLLDWKERIGARMSSHDFYRIDIKKALNSLDLKNEG